MSTTILFIGDIVGKPGRKAVTALLPQIRNEYQPDIVIANVENIAHGKGMTRSTLGEVLAAGVDIGTGGNHTFSKPEGAEMFREEQYPLVRPGNFGSEYPGVGKKNFSLHGKTVCVINLLGQHAMAPEPVETPFATMERYLHEEHQADAVFVDMHAETTSEKVAMGWYLDGKVSAVIGTHTHIPTADARLLPKGTAYMTDAGMVGLKDSSLGVDKDLALQRFLTGARTPFEIPDSGTVAFNAVLITCERARATSIERLYREIDV